MDPLRLKIIIMWGSVWLPEDPKARNLDLGTGPQQLLFLSGFRDRNGKSTHGFLGLKSKLGKTGQCKD